MDHFGRENAGKPTTSDSFIAALSADRADLKNLFSTWLDSTDALPTLQLSAVSSSKHDAEYLVTGEVRSTGGCAPGSIDITLETDDDETTTTFPVDSGAAHFEFKSSNKPTRLIVNKYAQTPAANGPIWACGSFRRDLEHTLIIYGTRTEPTANRIAAEKLQQAMIDQWEHATIPILPDTQVKEENLRGHHLLLIGRPECSELITRLTSSLPVTFSSHTFTTRGQPYAHAQSAVLAASVNPIDPNYSLVSIAGLSPNATLRAALTLPQWSPAPIKLLIANHKPKDLVPPAPELICDLK
jgi:hypothetical protein